MSKVETSGAARGAGVTVGGQVIRFAVQTLSVVLLTRLLSPTDYGIVAIVMTLVAFGELFREFGLSAATIQADKISDDELSTLFWVNVGIGAILAIIMAGASFVVADLYHDPRLRLVVAVLSVVFVFNGIAAQFRAWLLRNMRFLAVSLSDVAAQVIGLVTGVVLALSGAGYWALVIQQLAIFGTTAAVLAISADWRPRLYFRRRGMRRFYSFGVDYTVTQIVVYLSQNIVTMIIGARFGAAETGLYNRAYQLTSMPLAQASGPATNLAIPLLSRLRSDPSQFQRYVVTGQILLVTLLAAVFSFAIPNFPELTRLILGAQWVASAPYMQILAAAVVFQALSFPFFWIFVSLGLTRSNLGYTSLTRTLQIVVLILASLVSVKATCWAIAVTSLVVWPCGLAWLHRFHSVQVRGLLFSGVRIVTVYALVSLGLGVMGDYFDIHGSVSLLPSVLVYMGVVILLYSLVPAFRSDLKLGRAIILKMTNRGAR